VIKRHGKHLALGTALVAVLVAGLVFALGHGNSATRTTMTAYFENANGIYPGDDVRILGVRVGKIETIQPEPKRVKMTLWVDDKFKVPAEAKAVIVAPSLVTARAVQLVPAYTGGPVMADGAVIGQDRTAVPVEYDDLRAQLGKLTDMLQPTQPGGVSTLGSLVNTAADNLRGQGADIRDTVIKLSAALSTLGDHSGDIFGTVKNLAVLVSALQDSSDLLRQLNDNLAAVTGLLSNDPNEVGSAVADLNTAITDVRSFVADHREALGTTAEKLAGITQAVGESIDEVKQALHIFPTTLQNFTNIYQPAQGALSGSLAGTNFNNPIQFICGAIQAASRLNAEQSAKLCVQYLAPIVKNRQYNFLGPLGFTPLVGAQARPNEVTYSEDWLRPDFVPPATPPPPAANPSADAAPPPAGAPLAAEAPSDGQAPQTHSVDPNAGLPGMLLPPGAGS
jgi:phospholipid/cholesterol/gamma-HCH transport system substrate-binding protein